MRIEQHQRRSELGHLRSRAHRYWKRLAREAITIAQERKIETRIIKVDDLNRVPCVQYEGDIILFLDKEGNMQDDALLQLARDSLPSLYRRYQEARRKYELTARKLENQRG